MSRGPGRIQRVITDLLAAEPHGVWTVAQLCQLAYPKQRVEKKHRVAMWRAIHHIELGPVWQLTERTDTESYLFNASSEESTLRLAFNRDRTRTYRKVGFEEWKQDAEHIEYAREAVQAFWRYHHASPIEKIDIDIAHAQKGLEFWQNSDLDLGSTYFLKRIAELNKRKAELTALASPPLPASN
jgi:hypothetical protein